MVAQTLAERGARVTVLDGGQRDDHYDGIIPDASFLELRQQDEQQHRYLLGDRYEGVPSGDVGAGAQLTPPRQYIVRHAESALPVRSLSFFPIESLAFGGLGAGWGLGCCAFSDSELEMAGLPTAPMRAAYATVAARIGISGASDDISRYTAGDLVQQPCVPLNATCATLDANYRQRRASLNRKGFYLGRPSLALLTQQFDGRRPTALREMEFYDDRELAAWRPWITVSRLIETDSIRYVGGLLVTHFDESSDVVTVHARPLKGGASAAYRCRKLILASGTLGTGRIVLRSLDAERGSLPLLCNPYVYVPCVVPNALGQPAERKQTALAQLAIFHDRTGDNSDVAMASLYGYRSLMMHRLLRQVPLAVREGREILRYLMPALIIAGIHFPDMPSAAKWIRLRREAESFSGYVMEARYALTVREQRDIDRRLRGFLGALRSIGSWPLKTVHPGYGASIHYAGTLPFADEETPFRLRKNGRLCGTRSIYVADGSGFAYLPAKGLTLSLMAYAHHVANDIT